MGKEREATGTLKKGVRTGEELNWEDNLELELGDGAADQELHVRITYLACRIHISSILFICFGSSATAPQTRSCT